MKYKPNKIRSGAYCKTFFPIISLILMIVYLVIKKNASLKTFWVAGLIALFFQFLIEKDKMNFGRKCVENLKNDTLLTCMLIFILAGILSALFKCSGFSDSLILLWSKTGFDARFLPMIVFIICCIFSTACGTSTGTISMAVPIFLPLSIPLGCNSALILGAIASGSFFGDNLSPISDTTIISVNALKVDLYATIKKRAKMSLMAFGISSIVYLILGFIFCENNEIIFASQGSIKTLIFFIVPITMFLFLLKTKDVISTLFLSNFIAVVLSILCGCTTFNELIGKNSIIIQGIESVFGVVIFWVLLYILIGFIPKEFYKNFILKAVTNRENDFKNNLYGVLTIIASILLFSNNTAAMSMMSCIINELFKNKSDIDKANIFDGLSCAIPGILPYNTAFMVMISLAYETGYLLPSFSIMQVPIFSVNSFCLLAIYAYIALKKEKDFQSALYNQA